MTFRSSLPGLWYVLLRIPVQISVQNLDCKSSRYPNRLVLKGRVLTLENLETINLDESLKVNTPMDREGLMYPIHIVAIRAKDVDLDRKLSILIKNGADIKHKYGANGLTGENT